MQRSIPSAAILAWLVVAAQVEAASFQGLGDLPGGEFSSAGDAVSADGRVVVGVGHSASGGEAFRWTAADGMAALGDLPGGRFQSHASGVSADGSVVVGVSASAAAQGEAFRWTAAGGIVGLGNLPGGDRQRSIARNVSDDGSVVVGRGRSHLGFEAYRWTAAGGMFGLGDLPGGEFESTAYAVSADGSVVVGGSVSDTGRYPTEAFRWTAQGGMVGLGTLRPGRRSYSIAFDVSADGSVVVGSANSPLFEREAFRWTSEEGMIGLGMLGANPEDEDQSRARGVSDDGSVIVGYSSNGGAFLWDSAHGMRDLEAVLTEDFGLDLAGWDLQTATGVSADGTVIVGGGENPWGQFEGWVAVIPEPSGLVLLTSSAVGLLSCVWPTRRCHGTLKGGQHVDQEVVARSSACLPLVSSLGPDGRPPA